MNKHIYIATNQFNGFKTFGLGTLEEILKLNYAYRRTTSTNLEFSKVIKDLDEAKVWKLFFFLKYSFELNTETVSWDNYKKTRTFDDSKWEYTLEEFVDKTCAGIKWFDTFTDVTHHYQVEGWDKYEVEEVQEEEVTSEELF